MTGVAIVSAGTLAASQAISNPTHLGIQLNRYEALRADTYGLTALQNPLTAWQKMFGGRHRQAKQQGTKSMVGPAVPEDA